MTIYAPIATNRTFKTLQDWIDRVAHLPERHDLHAWMREAETIACDAGEGDIVLEMQGIATATGNPSTIKLDRSVFDWLPIEDN